MRSDFSVFHRIADPMQLPSSRFFQFAERLVHYDGAVRHALAVEYAAAGPPPPPDDQSPAVVTGAGVDVATVASLSQTPGFPGVAYTSGG